MNATWNPQEEPPVRAIAPWRWGVILIRAVPLVLILVAGVCLTMVLRLVEAPLFGTRRPMTPFITVTVCRLALLLVGLRLQTVGKVMRHRGAVVVNHSSWLDVFALNACKRVYFVSKSEVASWPGIGLLARITGTVFITRDPKQAKDQLALFEARLRAGHKLLFFPEGTSTDGMRVLPFKTSLFQSFFSDALRAEMHIQPVTLIYTAPNGRDARFYGWWGEMGFATHLVQILAATRPGKVKIIYHPPVKVSDFTDRKALARHAETAVRAGMPNDRQVAG